MNSHLDKMKRLLDDKRPLPKETAKSILDNLLLRYHQESNAIEGNHLTLVETKVLLEHGMTAKGKPFKDHLDIINHQEAVYYLMQLVEENAPLSERAIKEFNGLLLKGTSQEREGGKYRNIQVVLTGSSHIPPSPIQLNDEMAKLIELNQQRIHDTAWHPIDRIAQLHAEFVAIHPFVDGNGRTGRLIMNLELLKVGYPLAILSATDREDYYQALAAADTGDYRLIQKEIRQAVTESLTFMLDVVDPQWQQKLNQKPLN